MKKISISKQKIDWLLLILVFFLSLFGILMVFNASSISALTDFGDKFYYVKEQGKWISIGFLGLIFASFFDYRRYYLLAFPLLITALILLVMVFAPGLGVKALGAHRWIDFRFFVLQPSEFTKLVTVIYLSAWLCNRERERFAAFLLLMAMVVGLVVLEPDFGTAFVLIALGVIIYFVSGAPIKQFVFLVPAVGSLAAFIAIAAPYRLNRLLTFFDSSADPLGASYHVRQILIGIGSGGLWGLGLGKSRQKFSYLPEASTDSIFAIIAEELGFIGATFLVGVFFVLLYRGYLIARQAPDTFGRLLAFGITSWFAMQIIVNLSAMVSLIPLTGIPLPFISYGGSSLVVLLYAVGILLNISKFAVKNKKV